MTLVEERTNARGEGNEPLIAVFVYGTLRVGQYNYDWLKGCVRDSVIGCTAKGSVYFVGSFGGYPVAKFDEDGEIVGDVLYCDPEHPDFNDMVRMELGAGYESREIEVRTPESETIEALAFHYLRTPGGAWIESGDWIKANRDLELAETFRNE